MRNSALRFRIAVLVVAAIGACSKSEQAPEQTQAFPPPTVHVVATDYAFQAPDSLPAGYTSFHLMNEGKELHHLVLLRMPEGMTMADFPKMDPAGPIPPDVVMIGGPNPANPSGAFEATVNLKPGHYVMFCVIPGPDRKPHLMKGMLRELTVTPSDVVIAEPVADVTIKLTDYSFEISTPLKAGRQVVRVEDAGPQPHELVLVKLEPGKTVEQMAQWTEKFEGPPPGSFIGGVAAITVGEVNFITLELTPGEYGLLCFLPDSKDRKLHLMHGMIKQISVM